MPSIVSDSIVLILIFTIAFWGGVQLSSQAIEKILYISIVSSIAIVIITYFLGSFITTEKRNKDKQQVIRVSLKTQIKYIAPLIVGFISGFLLKISLPFNALIDYELYVLAFIIGIAVGKDLNKKILRRISNIAISSILIVIVGGIISSIILFIIGIRPYNLALSISLGSGWYSYTGPIVAKYYGPIYGVIGFLVNFLREQLTFSLLPFLLRTRSSPIGAIAVGGATSMDVTLGFYIDVLGNEYGVGALISGVIITLIVPVILPIILIL
uniref:Lysine exporter LysO family protein n=1 Tax=Acidianus sulfidivorans JP7 TaxID=619593 RepID=A0A2U9IPJ4_9CREN